MSTAEISPGPGSAYAPNNLLQVSWCGTPQRLEGGGQMCSHPGQMCSHPGCVTSTLSGVDALQSRLNVTYVVKRNPR